ncbi:MAG: 50S ribosomal protein L2 [Alphaproteobacteria bacterium]|nr:50S ribosomal protein L2 [Alphaproteobacteria bacterium]MBL0718168.1 50S ribosomal protein L2 [Alphaproteobacteria bacterium]
MLKIQKPTSAGLRHLVQVSRDELHKGKPEKTLLRPNHSKAGRNNHGRITVRHQGGGHKRKYRVIDFKRNILDIVATVLRIEYDPCRTAFIALVEYNNEDKEKRYIIATDKMKSGDNIIASKSVVDVISGNAMPVGQIPVGTIIHNIELTVGKGAILCRSAGTSATLIGKEGRYVLITLASGEVRKVFKDCMATVGVVSNIDQRNVKYGKAGRRRWLGQRPGTRGTAMNPVDHPLGGGNGKGGKLALTPWGKPSRGFRTRKCKRTQKFIVRSRHLAKKK